MINYKSGKLLSFIFGIKLKKSTKNKNHFEIQLY
jgi:hypothetical protein